MSGFFRRFFNRHQPESTSSRVLERPWELNVGDYVVFDLLDQPDLSQQRMGVKEISTYVFNRKPEPVFALEAGGRRQRYFLAVLNSAEGPFLGISRLAGRALLEQVFDLDRFARLFEEGSYPLTLERRSEPRELQQWTAPVYHQTVNMTKGTWIQGDYREASHFPPGEGLDFYQLVSGDERFALDVEVYDSGETNVSFSVWLPLNAIEEMWPAS